MVQHTFVGFQIASSVSSTSAPFLIGIRPPRPSLNTCPCTAMELHPHPYPQRSTRGLPSTTAEIPERAPSIKEHSSASMSRQKAPLVKPHRSRRPCSSFPQNHSLTLAVKTEHSQNTGREKDGASEAARRNREHYRPHNTDRMIKNKPGWLLWGRPHRRTQGSRVRASDNHENRGA